MLHEASVSVRKIAWFSTATMRAIPLASLLYRDLQMQMNSLNYNQKEVSDKYNIILSLNPGKTWNGGWLSQQLLGAPVYPQDHSITIHSDASNQGWGAVLNRQSHTEGIWSTKKATHRTNYLEFFSCLPSN